MKIQPARDHILIRIKEPDREQKTNSGIILQQKQSVKVQNIGKVIAVGEKRILQNGDLVPHEVEAEDEIIFYDYAGVKIVADGLEEGYTYLIIRSSDVIAKIS